MSKVIIVLAILLVGCSEQRQEMKANELSWENSKNIDITRYQSEEGVRISTFELDGYKFVIYLNGYGSDMEVIIPLDTNSNELDEYIRMLEEENQIFGSLLAEKENQKKDE